MHQAPEFPVGSYQAPKSKDMATVAAQVESLAQQPSALRDAVRHLTHEQLETRYRNWTVRQIVHHLADSVTQFHVRWRLALTEDRPTIKPYNEGEFVRLADSALADHELSLTLFEASVARLVIVAKATTPAELDRAFHHPQYQRDIPLWQVASICAWHGAHHTAQIMWLRQHYRW